MTQREKKLAIMLGGALGLFGAYKAVMSTIIEPRRNLKSDLDKAQARKTKLEERLLGEVGTERTWQHQTALTLAPSDKRDEAHDAFRADVIRLLKENKLPEKGVQNRQAAQAPGSKTYRKNFFELPVVVDTEGTLEQLTTLLHDIYELGYHVMVDRLNINPKDGEAAMLAATNNADTGSKPKRGGKPGRGAGATESPQLKIHLELSTLVLPRLEGVPHLVFKKDQPNAKPPTRMQFPNESDYRGITENNLFAIWQPPVRVVVESKPDNPTQVTVPDKNPTAVVQVDPRKSAEKFILTGTVTFGKEPPVAFVIDKDKRTDPATQYRLNDNVDDGKLVLIHGSGMVVKVSSANASQPPKLYYYALGENFKKRQELTAESFPEIFEIAQVVLRQ